MDFPVEITEQRISFIRIRSWRKGTHFSKAQDDTKVSERVIAIDFTYRRLRWKQLGSTLAGPFQKCFRGQRLPYATPGHHTCDIINCSDCFFRRVISFVDFTGNTM